jgi:hypothetical protein
LVGLAEWVWVQPKQWRTITKRVSAGAVWAQVSATPKQLTVTPSGGVPGVQCNGPGTPFDPRQPVDQQRSDCTVTFTRSSAGQPGGAYAVTVTVVWAVTWTGSGGAGGALPDMPRSSTFQLRVAEGQTTN